MLKNTHILSIPLTKLKEPKDLELLLIENPDNLEKPLNKTRFLSKEDIREKGKITEKYGKNPIFPSADKNPIKLNKSDDKDYSIQFEKTEEGLKIPKYFEFDKERAFSMELGGNLSFDTTKYENADYFLRMIKKISKLWHSAIPLTAHYMGLIPTGDVQIVVLISKDGSLLDYKIVKDFHYPSMTRAAEYAVKNSAPYEPFPESIKEEAIIIPIIFRYIAH